MDRSWAIVASGGSTFERHEFSVEAVKSRDCTGQSDRPGTVSAALHAFCGDGHAW